MWTAVLVLLACAAVAWLAWRVYAEKVVVSGGAVVITGCSSGIGRAVALHLASSGFYVIPTVRSEKAADELVAASKGKLARDAVLLLDVTDDDAVFEAAERVRALCEAAGVVLVGVVNNAGCPATAPLEVCPPWLFRRALNVNLTAPFIVSQAFMPLLREGKGRIVNMGSVLGVIAPPTLGAYSASKFGLEAVSDALRNEVHHWGVKVIILECGLVRTDISNRQTHDFDKLVEHNEAVGQLYPKWATRYQALSERGKKENLMEDGIPPEDVAAVVQRVLTVRSPPARFMLGREKPKIIAVAHVARCLFDYAMRTSITLR